MKRSTQAFVFVLMLILIQASITISYRLNMEEEPIIITQVVPAQKIITYTQTITPNNNNNDQVIIHERESLRKWQNQQLLDAANEWRMK